MKCEFTAQHDRLASVIKWSDKNMILISTYHVAEVITLKKRG